MSDNEADSGGVATPATRTPSVKPPRPLDVSQTTAKSWKLWKQLWENYSIVAGLDLQDERYQKAIFLCTIGEDALEIFNVFEFSDSDDPNKVSTIIQKFDEYFAGDINETYERYKFNQRRQLEGENFDTYLTELRNLRKNCNFCQCLSDSLLRDRIVLGIRDDHARKRLLQERKLDLKQCIDICKSVENATTHMGVFGTQKEEIMAVSNQGRFAGKTRGEGRPRRERGSGKFNERSNKPKCKFCLRNHILKKKLCPAWQKRCDACGTLNHWKGSEFCKKKQIHSIAQNTDLCDSDSDSDVATYKLRSVDAYVNGVKADKGKPVFCEMLVASKPVKLQIDCGATVCLIPKSQIGDTPIDLVNITLEMWNKRKMKALGVCKLVLLNPKTSEQYLVKFVVVQEELTPLLSRKAAEKMKLITVNYEGFQSVRVVDEVPCDIPAFFPSVFNQELGTLPGTVHLILKPDAEPVVRGPKRIPVELKEPVKNELDRLVGLGVLTPVEQPTDWVSQMAIGMKKGGGLRICIDPRPLNCALKREHYQLPILEDILPDLTRAKVFSKVDLRHGYWHCSLDQQSSDLTTFVTPFGRYQWTRLPFGLSASSEIFQKRLVQALEGLPGIVCIADDILVYGTGDTKGEAEKDHDQNLRLLMERCQEMSIKLNPEKLMLKVQEIDFMGHRLTAEGLRPDPSKVEAIVTMEAPKDRAEVQRFCGAVNYLVKFLPKLSDVIEPIRQLTKSDIEWHWMEPQEKAFKEIKALITQAPVLAYYDPNKELTIQCDASGRELGAALLQEGRPVAYASRALSDAETRYATIEKEVLAIVYALEKWHQFAFARHVTVITDHKPLEAIVKKPIDRAPKRLQGMLLRCLAYDVKIQYNPGTTMHLADMMSRAYLPTTDQKSRDEFECVNAVKFLPMREEKIQQIRAASERDGTMQLLKTTILEGWPEDKDKLPPQLAPFYSMRDELGVHDGLVFKGERLVVPQGMREQVKKDIHISHNGVEGCLRRARECVYWPCMNSEIRHWISTCEPCRQFEVSQGKETDEPRDPREAMGEGRN